MRWLSGLFAAARTAPAFTLEPEQRQALADWQALPAVDLSLAHERSRYVVVDVETSGLNMKNDRLISIGAVALVDGRIDFSDAFAVVLQQASDDENVLIHGLGGAAQRDAVEPTAALLAFLRYIGKAPLIAYHAFFNRSMIEKAMADYLGGALGLTWIDLAWVLPGLLGDQTHGQADSPAALDDWLKLFALENLVRHNAVSDAYATAQLLQVGIAAGRQQGANSPAALVEIEKARRWMHQSR